MRRVSFRVLLCVMIAVFCVGIAPAWAAILLPNQELSATLTAPESRHEFWLPEGQTAVLLLESRHFDPYLILLGPSGRIAAQDDDSGGTLTARIEWTPAVGGWFTAVVTSPGGRGRGEYVITLRQEVEAAAPGGLSLRAGADALTLPWGVWTSGTHVGPASPGYDAAFDGIPYRFTGHAGENVSILMQSSDLDAYLYLLGPHGEIVAENDDYGVGTDSLIVARLPVAGDYTVVASRYFSTNGSFRLLLEALPELFVFNDELQAQDSGEFDGPAHEYSVKLRPGAVLHAWLQASFDAYLQLLDSEGAVVAEDDDSGGVLDARMLVGPLPGGEYRLRVTSAFGDDTGEYALYLWGEGGPLTSGAQKPERVDVYDFDFDFDFDFGDLFGEWFDAWISLLGDGFALDEAVLPLSLGEVVYGELDEGEFHDYVLALPPGGGVYDIWLFAESDFDLYADLVAPIGADGTITYASETEEGYEHLRIEVEPGTDTLFLQVYFFEDYAYHPVYHLLAHAVEPDAGVWPRRDLGPGETARFPFAGELVPGERRHGRIDYERFSTQYWTISVPEGVRTVSVGVFNASADIDLSVDRGWSPSDFGFAHPERSITARENERYHLHGGDGFVEMGLYTVAVWSAIDAAASYQIEVAFDVPLPPSSTYVPIDPLEVERMKPTRLAQLATVQIENDLSIGSGTILTPDGLILTNYHVVAQCLPGSPTFGCRAPDPGTERMYIAEEQIIALTDERKGHGVQQFTADVVRVLPEYDLALVQIIADIDGNPVGELRLPTLTIDVSDGAAVLGDDVLAVGYYEIARLGARVPLSLTRGIISGFTLWDDRRIFLQMDAGIAGGSSGGALVRLEDGVLVGVPSARSYSELNVESQNFARPTSLLPEEWVLLLTERGGNVVGR